MRGRKSTDINPSLSMIDIHTNVGCRSGLISWSEFPEDNSWQQKEECCSYEVRKYIDALIVEISSRLPGNDT